MSLGKGNIKKCIKSKFLNELYDIIRIQFAVADISSGDFIYRTREFMIEDSEKTFIEHNDIPLLLLYMQRSEEEQTRPVGICSTPDKKNRFNASFPCRIAKQLLKLIITENVSELFDISNIDNLISDLYQEINILQDIIATDHFHLDPPFLSYRISEKIKKTIKVTKAAVIISESEDKFSFPSDYDSESEELIYALKNYPNKNLLKELRSLQDELILNSENEYQGLKDINKTIYDFFNDKEISKILEPPIYISPLLADKQRFGFLFIVNNKQNPVFQKEDIRFFRIIANQTAVLMKIYELIQEPYHEVFPMPDNKYKSEILNVLSSLQIPAIPGIDLHMEINQGVKPGANFADCFEKNGKIVFSAAEILDNCIIGESLVMSYKFLLHTLIDNALQPAEIISRINSVMNSEVEKRSLHISAFIGIYDPGTREMIYANAGYPEALLKYEDSEKPMHLSGCDEFVGASIKSVFINRNVKINKGAKLLIYNNGTTHITNKNNIKFDIGMLSVIFAKNSQKESKEIAKSISKGINIFTEGNDIKNSTTLIVAGF